MPSTTRKTPLGLKVIVALGLIGALLSTLGALGLMGTGSTGLVIGLALLVFTAIRVVILFGLISLSPWAWKAGVALYTLAAVVDLLRVDILGLLISLLIAAYIYSQKDLFRRY
ncbi:hypothetical protein SAMN04487949_1096 [Halogranum gelatinilyticum]|uniref:Uncharacterized protein n=1 Tax=Halogranum gelatinilyticum TaxID=660521 RepID=A0A1G9QYS7_9EURY|nr:hypothetical protein [Halogranum gelatinilyticum]SDM16192.1 hypothetical protein SAMN04487949_1096 [Halogranum gelatinilyticum]